MKNLRRGFRGESSGKVMFNPYMPRATKRAIDLAASGATVERQTAFQLPLCLCVIACALIIFCTQAANGAEGRWIRQPSGSLAWLHAIHFVDENKGWAVGGNGVLLTTLDSGKSWKAAARRPTQDVIRDLYFTDSATGWLLCERSVYALTSDDEPQSYLQHTTDGGATWQRVDITNLGSGVKLTRVIFADRENGWVFGDMGALYATRDGGSSWTKQHTGVKRLLLGGAFPSLPLGWLVGARSTVLRTSDGGETWNEAVATVRTRRASDAKAPLRLNAIAFVDAQHGWIVGSGGCIFATTNGGRTWQQQQSNVATDLFDVKFVNTSEGWAAGAGGTIIHTTNGGAQWQAEESGTTHTLERLFFINGERGWAVGFGGTILHRAPNPGGPKPSVLKGIGGL